MSTAERLNTTAGDIMSSPPITIHGDETLADAADLMLAHHIGALPIVDDDGKFVCMLTERAFESELAGVRPTAALGFQQRTLLQLYIAGSVAPNAGEIAFERARDRPVKDFATTRSAVVQEDDPLWTVSKAMMESHFSHVLVARGTEPVGVIARHDLLKVFAGSED